MTCISRPSPESLSSSCTSSRRHCSPLMAYSLPPLRNRVREMVTSLYSMGRAPSALSMVRSTSARPSGPLVAVPAKMTSSILPPRRVLAPCSPITQASASTTFDLPEPLGPTTAVTPGSKANVVGVAKDLNPLRVRLFRYTRLLDVRCPRVPGLERRGAQRAGLASRTLRSAVLRAGLDLLGELLVVRAVIAGERVAADLLRLRHLVGAGLLTVQRLQVGLQRVRNGTQMQAPDLLRVGLDRGAVAAAQGLGADGFQLGAPLGALAVLLRGLQVGAQRLGQFEPAVHEPLADRAARRARGRARGRRLGGHGAAEHQGGTDGEGCDGHGDRLHASDSARCASCGRQRRVRG